jgi:hypothetical protein
MNEVGRRFRAGPFAICDASRGDPRSESRCSLSLESRYQWTYRFALLRPHLHRSTDFCASQHFFDGAATSPNLRMLQNYRIERLVLTVAALYERRFFAESTKYRRS